MSLMTAPRLQVFVMIHVCAILGGWLGGQLLDAVLFSLSFDYVYPPHCFQRRGLFLGCLGASFIWLIVGTRNGVALCRRRRIVLSCVVAALVWGVITFCLAFVYSYVSSLIRSPDAEGETWPRRFLYCRYLPVFAVIGWIAANAVWLSLLRHWRPSATESAGSLADIAQRL